MNSPTPQAPSLLLAQISKRWKHCDEFEEFTLLRLMLLRDIALQVHRDISSFLAAGDKAEALAHRNWARRLEELKDSFELSSDLDLLVKSPIRKKTRLLPESLLAKIPREKFERYDRTWEAAIAAEGCAHGWQFWSVDVRLEISEVEAWNTRFSEQLWPNGIILFVESAEQTRSTPETKDFAGGHFWTGRWITLLHHRFKSPTEIPMNLDQTLPQNALKWKLVYAPKKR